MAPLIPDARATRMEAEQLRRESLELKLHLRASATRSRERLQSAEIALARAQAQRDRPLPSPWSTLHWTYASRELEHTLVPLP